MLADSLAHSRVIADPSYDNRCTLRITEEDGSTYDRDFFAPADGGYVRENWSNPRQVCERLESAGSTLIWNPRSGKTLADVIRYERQRAIRKAKRDGWL